MKKSIMAFAVLINCTYMMAQSEFDAFKYVQTDINGTARYMSMAGAFGALGGDVSAIKDNPAGLGIYRASELVGTVNVTMQNSKSNWNGLHTNYSDSYKSGFNNLGLVFVSPYSRNASQSTGLLSTNWSFGYNRLKSFNRSINISSGLSNSSITDYVVSFTDGKANAADFNAANKPYDNLPWISVLAYNGFLINPAAGDKRWASMLTGQADQVTPSYFLTEKGYVDEYSITWAGNFSNMFYFGAALNFQDLDYLATSTYSEDLGKGRNMGLKTTNSSKGNGVNLNVGTIIRPTDYLRFGLAIHTPTILAIKDHYFSELNSKTDSGTVASSTPTDGENNFQIQGPMQLNASVAYILGKKAVFSAEYVFTNYTSTRMMTEEGESKPYLYENEKMKTNYNNVQTVKLGAEYKLTDNFSARAGYAFTSNASNPNASRELYENTIRTDTEYFLHNKTNYLTAGFGYREASWFIDCAYMHKIVDETFVPYNTANLAIKPNPASLTCVTNNIVLTLGLKF